MRWRIRVRLRYRLFLTRLATSQDDIRCRVREY